MWEREQPEEAGARGVAHRLDVAVVVCVENAGDGDAFGEIGASYFSQRRYLFMFPHVVGAIFWWNLYFLQLIPQVRHAFDKKLHRILGRCLMVCAFLQTASGLGLAMTTHSNIILLVSLVLFWAVWSCDMMGCTTARSEILRTLH